VRPGIDVTISCQLLPFTIDTGPANMACDEAFLELAASRGDLAFLRTYGWSEPTLSLGYFQPFAESQRDARWRGVSLVRRATGGGAIWHEHELTYAAVLPDRHPLARPHTALYRSLHSAILQTLRERGIDATRRGEADPSIPDDRSRKRPFLCFTDHDPEDIVCKGFKVVGSAQRRRAGAILQHGSILLRRADRTPELHGICDLSEADSDPSVWSVTVLDQIRTALGLAVGSGDLPEGVARRARELEESIYRNEAWTLRR
jgi:lipoate-protein ligase A